MNVPLHSDETLGPSRPQTLTVEFFEQDDSIVIHKKRGGGPWPFLLLWLTGWTAGCVLLAGKVLDDPSIGTIAFAVPFWASWLLVFCLLVWMLFGKETFYLGRDDAVFLQKAFVRLSSRNVPRQEIRQFQECLTSYTENDEYLWGIEMITLGKPVRFAFRLPDHEREWLIHQLNRFLATTGPVSLPPAAMDEVSQADEASASSEKLDFESTLAEPPADCRWRLVDSSDCIAFWEKGRLNIGIVAGALFLNLFWNGIVSVFVMVLFGVMGKNDAPQGGEWWFMFVFLIPFEVIGLIMFALLVIALLEPFRRTTWRFESEWVVRQTRYLVFCLSRTWNVIGTNRLELRRNGITTKHPNKSFGSADWSDQFQFELAVVSSDNKDVCNIRELTEGEARWMAGVLLQERPKQFGAITELSRREAQI